MDFIAGETVIFQGVHVKILEVEKNDPKISPMNMGRYKVQFSDGHTLSNAPGYLMQKTL